MPDNRRWVRVGGTYFFIVVTFNRKRIFCNELVRSFLHRAIAQVRALRPFKMPGVVLLLDHCHCIWKMPDDDNDFSVRWRMIKGGSRNHCYHPVKLKSVSCHSNSWVKERVYRRDWLCQYRENNEDPDFEAVFSFGGRMNRNKKRVHPINA